MKTLSDEEREQISKAIHESYEKEVSLIKLSDEECRQIAQEVHEDFERISKKVAQECEELNRISREKAIAKIEQEKQDAKLIKEMKGSFFKRLFGL